MPEINASDLARLRERRQWSQVYLVVHKPNDLLTAVLSDPSLQAGDRDIPFVNGAAGAGYSQALFDALDEGTTLWVGSYAGGRDEGIVRVKSIERNAWPPTTGILHLAENSDIHWENGQYLTVKDEHRIWPKFPRVVIDDVPDPAVITWYKDWDIVHDWQTHEEPPVVIMGPPAVAFIDSGLATLRFWGNDSYSPRATALSGTIQWLLPNGTPGTTASLGTEVSPHTVTWTLPGVHMVRLMITDADGHVSYGYRPVFILNRSGAGSPYQDFEIRSMRGSFSTGGWGLSVRVFEDANVEDFPEGAMIIMFSEDWYGGEERSIGGYGDRENIVFVGCIKADTVRKEPMTGEIVFQAHTVDGELRNCPGFPTSVESVTDTPANWNEIQDMTLDLVGFYLGYWHSTLYEVTDVLQSGDTRAVKYMDITQANLYNQLDRGIFNETIFTRVLSDRQSRVKYDTNPQFLPNAGRDALDTIMTIEDEDWLGRVDIQEIQQAAISWIDLSGVRVDDQQQVQPVFSLAPGDTPKPDGAFRQFTRLVLTDQDDGNRIAGFALANQNKTHPDRTMGLSRVTVPFQGNYRIFDLHPQEWLLFPSLVTLREGQGPGINPGTPWPTGTRFIPRDIDIGYRNEFGSFLVTIGMEPETWGPAGTPGYYPEETPDDPTDTEPEEPPEDPPGEETEEGWVKKLYAATNSLGIYYTRNFSGPGGGDPIWQTVNDGLGTTNTRCIMGDPWNPSYRQYTRTTEPKIYRRTGGGSWGVILDSTIVAARTGLSFSNFDMCNPAGNINAQGHVYTAVRFLVGSTWYLYFFKSTDYGDNWTATLVSTNILTYPWRVLVGALQGSSSYGAGQVIYIHYRRTAPSRHAIRVSTNQGGAFGSEIQLGSCGTLVGGSLGRSPADQDVLYSAGWGSTPTNYTLEKSTERGGSLTTLWACAASPTMVRHPGVSLWDPDFQLMPAGSAGLHITEDDWGSYVTHTNLDNFDVDGVSRVQDYPENLYGFQGDNPAGGDMQHVIAVSNNRGDNWEGKAGASPDAAPYTASIPNNAGGVAMILQIWTE